MPAAAERLVVVGIGADGWSGLTEAARSKILAADVVVGAPRQLALLPAVENQHRRTWDSPMREHLAELFETYPGNRIVVLASGDPMLSGVGTTLVDMFGIDRVAIVPQVSSVALARARLGWSAESTAVISTVGRDVHAVLREFTPGRRLLVLSADENTPAELAGLLTDFGYGASRMVVLGDLGVSTESRQDTTPQTFRGAAPRLNIVALELAGPLRCGIATGLPDDVFEHDGQLTKRDLRASALARLVPFPGQLLWDVGAGAGSVGIEWMRTHATCRTVAVESDHARAQRISRNARKLGVPGLEVVCGTAPEALTGLDVPDAVFLGGGATRAGIFAACLDALRPGGRLVVHGVTVETEALLAASYREHGGELTRIHVENAAPVGSFTGWTPARGVTQWALTLP